MTVLEQLEREALAVVGELLGDELAAERPSAERTLEAATEVIAGTPLTPARACRLVAEHPDWLLRSCELPADAGVSPLDVLQALLAEHIVRVVCASAGCEGLEERLHEWPGCRPRPVAASGVRSI